MIEELAVLHQTSWKTLQVLCPMPKIFCAIQLAIDLMTTFLMLRLLM